MYSRYLKIVKMDKNCTEPSIFYFEIRKNFGLNLLNRSKAIALLNFIKFTRDVMEVRHIVCCSR
jgi:hypothetical protein